MANGFLSGCEKYPKELLYKRKTVEGNVIACIYKDILLLDETKLQPKDFVTEDGIFYFSLAKNIRDKGFSSIDEITILSNISDTTEIGFSERGGWLSIQNLIDVINEKNWDTYLDILYRENIILNLHNNGFNLLNPLYEDGKTIIPLDLFRKMDSESVLDWYDNQLAKMSNGSSSKILEEGDLEITDEFIEEVQDGVESGVPFDVCGEDVEGNEINCFPYISNQVGGLLRAALHMLGGFSSSGKTTMIITILMGLVHKGEKVLIITNEQKKSVFLIQFLTWILAKRFKYFKVTKKKIKNRDELTDEDKLYIKKAQHVWNTEYKHHFKFIQISDADISIVKKKVRQYALSQGFTCFLYDTFKAELSNDKNDQNWLNLIKDSRELDKLTKRYNLIGLANVQLAEALKGTLFLDASVLSQSKQIKEVLETLLLIRPVFSEELDKTSSKYFCRPFRRVKIQGKWCEEEYQIDETGVYRMLFFEKNRNGENSSDTGVAMLLKFNGNVGTFSESAYCRPKHGRIGV
jgi:replicative DNA helicase